MSRMSLHRLEARPLSNYLYRDLLDRKFIRVPVVQIDGPSICMCKNGKVATITSTRFEELCICLYYLTRRPNCIPSNCPPAWSGISNNGLLYKPNQRPTAINCKIRRTLGPQAVETPRDFFRLVSLSASCYCRLVCLV